MSLLRTEELTKHFGGVAAVDGLSFEVVVGGMGSLTGPIVGALIVYVASEWLREVGNIQMIVFSLAVILFARFLRTGLWGLAARAR